MLLLAATLGVASAVSEAGRCSPCICRPVSWREWFAVDELPSTSALLGTAAQHATTRVPVARPDETAGDVLTGLTGGRLGAPRTSWC